MEALGDIFHLEIGDFECLFISDGTLAAPDPQFIQLPSEDLSQPGQPLGLTCLLLTRGEHRVLIDTGLGVGVEPSAGKLLQNLQAAGIQREEVDTIILSHGHHDHVGGSTDAEGRPVFPNARYFLRRNEWEYWTSEPSPSQGVEKDRLAMHALSREKLMSIQDQVCLVDDETEIISGIELIAAPGHTPGNVVLTVSSGGERLVCVGDVIHHPSELSGSDLYNAFDTDPEQAKRTRATLLSRLATLHVPVFACHFPFPGVGYVVNEYDEFFWQPIKVMGRTR